MSFNPWNYARRYRLHAGAIALLLLMLSPVFLSGRYELSQPPENISSPSSGSAGQHAAEVFPYLVLDLKTMTLSIQIEGVPLRDCRATAANDTATVGEFSRDWLESGAAIQRISRVHLLSGAKTLSQVELEAIAEVTGLSEAATQRYLPAEMIIETSEGQRLEIRTDLEGEEISALGGFEETLRRIVSTVEGKETLRLYMSGPDAMSIFGLARTHPLIILKG
ncbi:MAG: hypothetical protein AB1483_02230 [Candidatus Zixiibacteriota bacterium]